MSLRPHQHQCRTCDVGAAGDIGFQPAQQACEQIYVFVAEAGPQPLIKVCRRAAQPLEGGLTGVGQLDQMDAPVGRIPPAGDKPLLVHRVQVVGEGRLPDSDRRGQFTLIAQALTYAVAWTRSEKPVLGVRRWVVTQFGIAALFLAWLPITIRWARSVGAGFWLPPMTIRDLWTSYVAYAGGSSVLFVVVLLLVVVGVYAQHRGARGITLMLCLATLPVVVPVIASILGKPTFTPRYGIVASAALFALAGCGVMALQNRIAQSLLVSATVALSLVAIRDIPTKPDWRGTVAQVESVARPRDYIVMTPRPGCIQDIVKVDLPRPRDVKVLENPRFIALSTRVRNGIGLGTAAERTFVEAPGCAEPYAESRP